MCRWVLDSLTFEPQFAGEEDDTLGADIIGRKKFKGQTNIKNG